MLGMSDAVFTTLCPAYRAIGVLQEKWVLHIVRALLGGEKGFNELARSVYSLTPAGQELQTVINAIDAWARAHLSESELPRCTG